MFNEKDDIQNQEDQLHEEIEDMEQQSEQQLERASQELEQAESADAEEGAEEQSEEERAVKAVADQLEQTKGLLMRTAAEYDNYRKRTDKEKAGSVALGSTIVLEKMLPVLDTLETAAESQCADDDYKKGVCMTLTMMQGALESLGVKEIEALGLPFDPNFHNAVAQQQTDEFEPGTVTAVMQKGYLFQDSVLRHAVVVVAS